MPQTGRGLKQTAPLYAEHVEVPLTHLVMELKRELSPLLPGIDFSPRKIAKPMLRVSKGTDGPVVRDKVTAFFAEAATSMFETNPGIYLSLGASPDDSVYGCGMYMPSARQMRELRPKLCADFASFEAIMRSAGMKKHWNGLIGDTYQRFPKEFDQESPAAQYLWHKQFFIGKGLTRENVLRSDFIDETVAAFKAASPFLSLDSQGGRGLQASSCKGLGLMAKQGAGFLIAALLL